MTVTWVLRHGRHFSLQNGRLPSAFLKINVPAAARALRARAGGAAAPPPRMRAGPPPPRGASAPPAPPPEVRH